MEKALEEQEQGHPPPLNPTLYGIDPRRLIDIVFVMILDTALVLGS